MPKLTAKEKSAELESILGVPVGKGALKTEDENGQPRLLFSDNVKKPFRESYVEEGDETEDDGTAFDADDAPLGQQSESDNEPPEPAKDDMPTWAQVLIDQGKQQQEELKSTKAELSQLRNYQAPAPAPVIPPVNTPLQVGDEPYWVDSTHLKEMEKTVNDRLGLVNDIATRQERQSFDQSLANLAAERPGFYDVIPRSTVEKAWELYKKDPARYGGFGREWGNEFSQLYKLANHDRLESELKTERAKKDEVQIKRDQKAQVQKTNLGKVSRSGTAMQEPKAIRERGVRDYKSPAVRAAALKLLRGE